MLPILQEANVSRDMINEFKGYNHNLQISPNEFFDMENMTSDFYPTLSPRGKRGAIMNASKIDGLVAKEKLCWVSDNKFYYNGAYIGTVKTFLDANGNAKRVERKFISMGAYLLIFPDKKYFNSAAWSKGETTFEFGKLKLPVFGSLEHKFEQIASASFILSKSDGIAYDGKLTEDIEGVKNGYFVGDTAPEKPENGDYWLDTSSKRLALNQYAKATEQWVGIATTYLRIQSVGIGVGLAEYDTVTISGCANKEFNGDFIVFSVADDYIVIAGMLKEVLTQATGLIIERSVPDMDFVTEGDNRVWGCSSDKHEIYACKLGNPWNWKSYMGLSTDSYTVSVGSDGDFTGACTYLGYLFFFKEEIIHRVYGTMPSNYNVQEIIARGVERGSEKSISIANETLFYKSRNGIMSFDGSLPESINYQLGNEIYHNAVSGACGSKYYVSMQDVYNKSHLFVYNQRNGLWHKEDNTSLRLTCKLGNELYYIDNEDNKLKTMNGSLGLSGYDNVILDGAQKEDSVKWFVESGNLGVESPDKKYISKLQLRISADRNTDIRILLQYDSSTIWALVMNFSFSSLKTYTIPIIPKRCDHLRIRIEGVGDCKIFSITKSTEHGSEL